MAAQRRLARRRRGCWRTIRTNWIVDKEGSGCKENIIDINYLEGGFETAKSEICFYSDLLIHFKVINSNFLYLKLLLFMLSWKVS